MAFHAGGALPLRHGLAVGGGIAGIATSDAWGQALERRMGQAWFLVLSAGSKTKNKV
jgi:hypothetical protein